MNGFCCVSSIYSSKFGALILILFHVILESGAVDQSLELSPGLDLQNVQEKGKTMASKPLELVEEQSSKTPENYNLRKSLAWDTAFFTSDGKSD